jgi:CBS domain-containing protein
MPAATPLSIADVMTKDPICATPGMTIRQLATIFAERRISGAPVVGTDGTLVGVVSRTDLFRRVGLESKDVSPGFLFDLLNDAIPASAQPVPESLLTIGDFMAESVVTATPTDAVADIAHRMANHKVHRVVVIDARRKPIGIVTALDLLRVFPV